MEEKIELNGESYVLEKSIKKDVVEIKKIIHFESKEYLYYFKQLEKMLHYSTESLSQTIALKQEKLVALDPANVLMVVGKTDRAKDLLRLFIWEDEFDEKKNTNNSALNLNYKAKEDEEILSKYSLNYMNSMISFFSYDKKEVIKLCTRKDFPLKMFNNDWEVIIAPRVDNE